MSLAENMVDVGIRNRHLLKRDNTQNAKTIRCQAIEIEYLTQLNSHQVDQRFQMQLLHNKHERQRAAMYYPHDGDY